MSDIGGISLEKIMEAATENLNTASESKNNIQNVFNENIKVTNFNSQLLISEIKDLPQEKSESKNNTKITIPYDYDLKTFINNIYALDLLSKTYNDLKDDVEDRMWFEMSVKSMVNDLFPKAITFECEVPIKCSASVDIALLNLFTYGQYQKYLENKSNSFADVFKISGLLSLKNVLEYPVFFDHTKSFSLCITTDKISRDKAESFLQYLIYHLAASAKKGDVSFRCADRKKGGQSYGKFINLIGSNKLFGDGIYSSESDISDLISDLNKIAEANFAQLKGQYKTVYDYNNDNDKKIPVTVAIFCDFSGFSYSKSNDELRKVINNSANSAISTIFLTDSNTESTFNDIKNQIHISFENNCAFLVDCKNKFYLDITKAVFSNEDYISIEEKLNKIEMVDTDFKSHFNLDNLNLFSKDATDGISVPFAFDEDNNFVDLEIGDVTPHALLSGSSGSGKSVTLHSIINQVMINYHPDDVEIWAIDYKAVEFGCYVNKRTPHITVIGQDNSEDFSFGLIDLIKSEYDRRKDLFVENKCKDFKDYRKTFGNRSLSRILIVIDEFHNMTQAISGYMGEKDYKQILENLLSEMRAMGMSFLFCSQTIASGLNGLTEKGRNQIGCRLSMRHEDITEIKETLSLSLSSGIDFESIKYLRQGELIYKKLSNKVGGSPYSLERVNVLYTEPYRDIIIDKINENIEENYIAREEIICKNSKRYGVTEKQRHPITKFIESGEYLKEELLTVYPGAPTSLKDYFSVELDQEESNNILVVGENDSMRESIIISSVLGMLIDPQNTIVASILDTEDNDNQRLFKYLSRINSDRLQINYGYDEVMFCIDSLKKIKPYKNGRIIYLWYGLNKLKNLIFLNSQEDDEDELIEQNSFNIPDSIPEGMNPLDFLNNALSMVSTENDVDKESEKFGDKLDYKDCQSIIKKLEEYGSENNRYCFMIFNTVKGLKKSKILNIDNYEYRIGLQMSTDDSYDLFGSTAFISKANDTTAVFYSGSKVAQTIRPYLLPDENLICKFNNRMEH